MGQKCTGYYTPYMAVAMSDTIRIQGLPQLKRAIERAPREIAQAIKGAGDEVANEILDTQGLRRYPPHTSANLPPTPYYVRGRGMQYKYGNNQKSERYGTKWTIKHRGYGTVIGNTASYARWLAGEEQASHMAPLGWRKLLEVAQEKLPLIEKIFAKWIERALKRAGLQ